VGALVSRGGHRQVGYEGKTTPGPVWLRKIVGDDFLQNVGYVLLTSGIVKVFTKLSCGKGVKLL
jgi:hypothetical protein